MRIRSDSFSRIAGTALFLAAGLVIFALVSPLPAASLGDSIRNVAGKLAPNAGATEAEEAAADDLGLSPAANLEINERERGIPKLLMSEQEMAALLGKDPAFIYDPAGREDPMLIPWIQIRVIAEEYERIGQDAIKRGDLEMADQAFRTIVRHLDRVNSPWIQKKPFEDIRVRATESIVSVANLMQRRGGAGYRTTDMGPTSPDQLPAWIQNSVTAVIRAGENSVCMVGPFALRAGDEVPGQDVKVVVAKIEENAVHFRVGENTFAVEVGRGTRPSPGPSSAPRSRR